MKKNNYIIGSLVTIALTLSSCDNMNDIHQKYLDMGEQVYPCKTDSLNSFPGYQRVKLVWYVNADPKVEQTVIYWNERQDSIVKPFVRTVEGVQKDSVIIEGLPEGDYLFELINKNQFGERSLTSVIQGKSYGETYASGLRSRPVTGLSCVGFNPATQSSSIKITWGEAPAGYIIGTIRYKKRSTGEAVTLNVSDMDVETLLTDVGNRLEHPDDILYFSSGYRPDQCIDLIEGSVQREQITLYMASGTRVENTPYDGSPATFTYAYTQQDKILRMTGSSESRVFECNRVAEWPLSTTASLSLTVNGDQSVVIGGMYAAVNPISNAEGASSFDPATQTFNLRYRMQASGRTYNVTETLVPKTTPVEKEVPKPFNDMRAVIPGDNNTEASASWPFRNTYDGIIPPTQNGWLPVNNAATSTSTSFTIDLKEPVTLTRMHYWQAASTAASHLFRNANALKYEMWGVAQIDESKLGNAAYWVDAANPAGTFKEDWIYLGVHELERIDRKGATADELYERMVSGEQFLLPTAGPVRYIRFYVRDGAGWATNPAYFFVGEFSFFGYEQ